MTLFRALPVLLLAVACTPSSPLKGPGLNDDGSLRIDAEGPLLVVVTHTKIAKGQVSQADMPPTWDQALAELDVVEPDPAF